MTEHQRSTGPDADHHLDAVRAELSRPQIAGRTSARLDGPGRIATWGDGLRMIAVTTERLATASGSAGCSGYLPTVPADSEEPALD